MPFSTEQMMIYTDSNRLYHGHVKQNVNSRTNENKETAFRIYYFTILPHIFIKKLFEALILKLFKTNLL